MKDPNKHNFNVILDTTTFEQLTAIALHQQVSRGAVMRAAIRYHFARLQHAREQGISVLPGVLQVVPDGLPEPQLTSPETDD